MIDTSSQEFRRNFYNSMAWRKLRQFVLERDHYECQWCKDAGKVTTAFDSVIEVDHIKELEFYPELALDPDNLRCLCKECHNKRHNRMQYRSQTKAIKWDDESFA